MLRPAILALVLLAPAALGAAPAWAWGSLACLIGALAAAQGGLLLAGRTAGPPPLPPGWMLMPLAALAAFALWQLTAPLPVHPLRSQLADALGAPAALRASPILHPTEARDAAVRMAAPAVLAWLVALAWTGTPVRPALAGLSLAGAVIAGYALAAHALDPNAVLWLEGPFYPTPTGPFVARGAFAAYLTLAMLAAAVVWLTRAETASGWASALAWGLMAIALLASQSRAGLAAAVAAHLLLLWLAVRGRWLAVAPAAGAALALLTGAALGAAAAGLDGRLADLPADLERRLAVWRAGLSAVAARPWTGHGLGSFPYLWELYRPPGAGKPVLSAHSTPLEWAAELGIPGALALLTGLLGIAWALLSVPAGRIAALAAPPALAAVLLQGAVDVGAQVPGVALTAALLVGLGLSRVRGPGGRSISHRAPR